MTMVRQICSAVIVLVAFCVAAGQEPQTATLPVGSAIIAEFKGEASLSWYLTRTEIDTICAQAASPGIAAKVAAVGEWLAR